MGDASTVVVKGLEAQLPLGASLTLEAVVAETHGGHELEQVVAGGIAQAVSSQDDWALIGSWSVAYDGTHENHAVVVEVEVAVDIVTGIEVCLSRSWSNCSVYL